MKEIHDVKYETIIRGFDQWRISAIIDGKRKITSSPVEYDEVNHIFKTKTGSVYKIVSFDCDKEIFKEYIKQDIRKGIK